MWSPSTTVAVLVDRDHAVGVAVEREPGVGAAGDDRARYERSGWVEPTPVVDVARRRASALSTSTVAPSARKRGGRRSDAAPLRAVERPRAARRARAAARAAATRRATYAVDGVGDLADADARAAAPSLGAPSSRIARARPRPRPRSRRGACGRRRSNSLTPLSANGLWLAEIIAPARAGRGARAGEPGVGRTPRMRASPPSRA